LAAAHAAKLADDPHPENEDIVRFKETAKDATRLRNSTAALMTREQLAEAQKLVREWQPVFEEGYVRDLQNEKPSGED
jgi:hypothetical protein